MTVWPEVELGDVCEFKYGKSLPAAVRDGGEFPVFGSNGVVGAHSIALTEGPTIVIGRKGSFGEVTYSGSPCWPIDTTYYVDPSATKADLKWLSYRLRALGLTSLNRAAAVPGLNREDAYRQRLLLPPLDEQQRIAAILDQADALRAKRRQVLSQLDSLTQSIFHDMFADAEPTATVGDVAEIQGGLQVSARRATLPVEVPYLRVANVHRGHLDLSDVKTLRATAAEVERTRLVAGDLLFVEGHANPREVGRVAVWDDQIEGCVHQNHLIRGRLDDTRVHPTFAAMWFNTERGAAHFRRASRTTSGLNTISTSTVRAAPIPLPPIGCQVEFAERVKQISAQGDVVRQALAFEDQLFSSLQTRAFRGEL